MKNSLLVVLISLFFPHVALGSCSSAAIVQDADLQSNPLVANFEPDTYITQQLPQDVELVTKMRQLFFEADGAVKRRDVYTNAVKNHGGQEVMLLTDDDVRVSALFFERVAPSKDKTSQKTENSATPQKKPINMIYVPGYFFDLTPPKEWGAPFALLFEDFNIMIIDSRGTGDSEGTTSLLRKNSYGTNAYPDIQAAVDFMRKHNDGPIILAGFCFGAAMVLHTTVQAQKAGKATADALVLNCTFSTFENLFSHASDVEDRWLQKIFLLESGLARLLVEMRMNGNLFDLNPIELIKDIKIPCYFEHFSYDPVATLSDVIELYNTAQCPKMFTRSDLGRHVRIHSKVPFQYKAAFETFLGQHGFLDHANPVQTPASEAQAPAAA